ncbi:AraC family transcriptional regulator [Acidovorax sp.]|uniref:AraC family transcriptional regulator n=1 Tax=Acidovorax sp. TaxID=1872122 RepID=UPI002ACD395F|nr:AraC family transcriptional regulator [Acidovorax sp.]MDZ7864685.1 AraC family transcriptional regulator [Acidovorax sp.]
MDSAGSLSLRQYGPSPGSHSHEHFQVLLGLAGALELEIDGRGMRVATGSGCVIAPGARHDFEASGGSLCLVLDSSDMGWTHCSAPALQSAPPPPALTLARYLASALQQGHPLAQAHGPALLLEAWQPSSPWIPQPPDAGARRRAIDWPALREWAALHWHRPLSVADMAQKVHLSPSQFAARCREEQGQGAMAWLRSQRLGHARLLRSGGMAVAEVARRTGYRSPSALTAALRRG